MRSRDRDTDLDSCPCRDSPHEYVYDSALGFGTLPNVLIVMRRCCVTAYPKPLNPAMRASSLPSRRENCLRDDDRARST